MNNKKEVYCVTTGEKFKSIADASRAKSVVYMGIINCCSGKQKTAEGLQWVLMVNGEPVNIPESIFTHGLKVKVKCIEIDETFESIANAAKAFQVTHPSIIKALKNKGTCRGYHWEYA